jgi:gas vesicle protein
MTDTATSWSPSDGQESTTDKAKTEAKEVGRTAAAAGGDVAHTAKEQGKEVARETARQARDLYGTTRAQLRDQASAQQRRAAGGIRSIGDEIRSMAEQGGQSGPASELAQQASGRIADVADWIEAREPGQVVDEVKQFARRHPGAFLAGAAILGVLAGRLTRGVVADAHDDGPEPQSGSNGWGAAPVSPTVPPSTVPSPTVAETAPDSTVYVTSTADPAVTPAAPVERGPWDAGTRP